MSATSEAPANRYANGLWDYYVLEINVHRLAAGIPQSKNTMGAWLDAKAARISSVGEAVGAPSTAAAVAADQVAMLDRVEAEENRSCIFYRDTDGRPSYEGRCLKAALKEAANILKDGLGKKAWRSKLAERVFVLERTVPITVPVTTEQRVVHAMTPMGPRTSIKSFEVAENVPLTFHLRVLKDAVVDEADLQLLLEYSSINGIGSDRSQGWGTFDLISFGPQK